MTVECWVETPHWGGNMSCAGAQSQCAGTVCLTVTCQVNPLHMVLGTHSHPLPLECLHKAYRPCPVVGWLMSEFSYLAFARLQMCLVELAGQTGHPGDSPSDGRGLCTQWCRPLLSLVLIVVPWWGQMLVSKCDVRNCIRKKMACGLFTHGNTELNTF